MLEGKGQEAEMVRKGPIVNQWDVGRKQGRTELERRDGASLIACWMDA